MYNMYIHTLHSLWFVPPPPLPFRGKVNKYGAEAALCKKKRKWGEGGRGGQEVFLFNFFKV